MILTTFRKHRLFS